MAITEKSRHELYRRLEEILGPDEATTLMEHLPPVGWSDVATKDDIRLLEGRIDQLANRLDGRIDSLANRLDGRIDSLDGRFDSFDGRIDSLDARIDSLDARLSARIDVLGSELRTEMATLSTELHSTLRTNAYLTIGAMAALVGLISAVATLA